jgi:hypothetical protein
VLDPGEEPLHDPAPLVTTQLTTVLLSGFFLRDTTIFALLLPGTWHRLRYGSANVDLVDWITTITKGDGSHVELV